MTPDEERLRDLLLAEIERELDEINRQVGRLWLQAMHVEHQNGVKAETVN